MSNHVGKCSSKCWTLTGNSFHKAEIDVTTEHSEWFPQEEWLKRPVVHVVPAFLHMKLTLAIFECSSVSRIWYMYCSSFHWTSWKEMSLGYPEVYNRYIISERRPHGEDLVLATTWCSASYKFHVPDVKNRFGREKRETTTTYLHIARTLLHQRRPTLVT